MIRSILAQTPVKYSIRAVVWVGMAFGILWLAQQAIWLAWVAMG